MTKTELLPMKREELSYDKWEKAYVPNVLEGKKEMVT